MGCGSSKVDQGDREAAQQSARIDRQLRHDRKIENKTVKILLLGKLRLLLQSCLPPVDENLLGAGESGKSTIIKQMRILYSGGFQEDERIQVKAVIYSNVVVAFRVLLEIMQEERIEYADEKTRMHAEVLEDAEADVDALHAFKDMRIKEAMAGLWRDTGVQRAVSKSHEYALNDNLPFYFANIDRMFDPDWIPGNQDMVSLPSSSMLHHDREA